MKHGGDGSNTPSSADRMFTCTTQATSDHNFTGPSLLFQPPIATGPAEVPFFLAVPYEPEEEPHE